MHFEIFTFTNVKYLDIRAYIQDIGKIYLFSRDDLLLIYIRAFLHLQQRIYKTLLQPIINFCNIERSELQLRKLAITVHERFANISINK